MEIPIGYVAGEALASIPPIDGCSFALLRPAQAMDDPHADAYLVRIDATGEMSPIAFIDGSTGAAYRCACMPLDGQPNPRDAGEEPLVKLVGDVDGETASLSSSSPRAIGAGTVAGIVCPRHPRRSHVPWYVPCPSADAADIWAPR